MICLQRMYTQYLMFNLYDVAVILIIIIIIIHETVLQNCQAIHVHVFPENEISSNGVVF